MWKGSKDNWGSRAISPAQFYMNYLTYRLHTGAQVNDVLHAYLASATVSAAGVGAAAGTDGKLEQHQQQVQQPH